MDPVTLVAVPGLLGGVVLAVIFFRMQRPTVSTDVFRRDERSTDVINMAHIRVAGIGGLGLVAMAATVAWVVPRIGQTLALGMVLGAVGATVLILFRRRSGPLTSSSRTSGANTTLSIDD